MRHLAFFLPVPPAHGCLPAARRRRAGVRERDGARPSSPVASVARRRVPADSRSCSRRGGRTAPRARRTARHQSSRLSPPSPGPAHEQHRHQQRHQPNGRLAAPRSARSAPRRSRPWPRSASTAASGCLGKSRRPLPPPHLVPAAPSPPPPPSPRLEPGQVLDLCPPWWTRTWRLGGGRERSRALPPAGDRAPVRGERLASSADGDGYHCRHRDYFLALAEEAKEALGGPNRRTGWTCWSRSMTTCAARSRSAWKRRHEPS
jgi:hypothetical protein